MRRPNSNRPAADLPTCFLASSDSNALQEPRRCTPIKRLRSDHRDDLWLARIDPPLIGQAYGLGGEDIDTVLVATRHVGASLFPVDAWPVYVHVARPLVRDLEGRERIHDREFESLAW